MIFVNLVDRDLVRILDLVSSERTSKARCWRSTWPSSPTRRSPLPAAVRRAGPIELWRRADLKERGVLTDQGLAGQTQRILGR